MKKKVSIIIGLCLCAFLSISFMMKQNEPLNVEEKKEKIDESIEKNKVEEILNKLSIEEKIGQMLIISNSNTTMTDSLKNILEQTHPGGIIFFKENFTDYETTKKLIEEIEATSSIPYILSTDQEGGRVQRMSELKDKNITKIPSMGSLGKTNDLKLAYNTGKVIAEELQVFGINMDFAPVIDIIDTEDNKVIGNRSFGTNATLVSDMGISLANGLKENGVIPVFKHFPGHGNTEVDSHYDLPLLSKTKEELLKSDLIPFQKAIDSGAEVIMIGHLAIPKITNDDTPASLSKILITDILKKEMNYQGLVITDALNMKAITNHYEPKEIYELAINAGVDILLMPKDPNDAINMIKESIKEGTIGEESINASVRKILDLKYNKLSQKKLDSSYLGSEEHQKIINQITTQ